MDDKEFLEKRLDLFEGDAWSLFIEELTDMAMSLDSIKNIDDEKTLFMNKGAVGILDMIINIEETTKFTLEQLDTKV
jgi:hypothetical protein